MTQDTNPVTTTDNLIHNEHEILEFWQKNQTFQKLVLKNSQGPIFRFLDGPITANNPMGVHHAWGRTLKDAFIRYKSMRGFNCNWQNGFDSQGLWVEVEVERELGFNGKKDIEAFGIEKFINACKQRVEKFSRVITIQSIRLGQWMDWDQSYFTHTDSNIEGIWHFLKVCHERQWLYQGPRLLAWCTRCETSLSEHEMTGSYQLVSHTAVYVRLPLKDNGSHILVWTTTPWTLAANVALAVNPDIEYSEVLLDSETQPVILATKSMGILAGRQKNILRKFLGRELIGLQYETMFPDIAVQKNIEHRIIEWTDVDPEEGTGVVHIAPACGPEDYKLAHVHNLPIVIPVDDAGIYVENFGWLSGQSISAVTDQIVNRLNADHKLFKHYIHEHKYPVCWRCKTEAIYRLINEWFINSDEVRPKLIEAARHIRWEPDYTLKRMEDWLSNMGDWNISRKRFYGLPLPIYPCTECGHVTVIGSKAELREKGGAEVDNLPELHRPWIDAIKIKCPNCGTEVERIQQVGDVWLDAGIVPFTTLGYFSDRQRWERYFPAEWITEMREQVRLWWYSMLYMGVVLEGRAPYERVLAYESVVAEDGTRFSKTGYMIRFDEAAEKLGADIMRYLFCSSPVTSNVRFGYQLGDEVRRKLLTFQNVNKFFSMYAQLDKPALEGYIPDIQNLKSIDRWMIARTNLFLNRATTAFEAYSTLDLINDFEEYIEDLSNWYVRVNRRRYWESEDKNDQRLAYWVLYHALRIATQVMAPILPFLTEYTWLNILKPYDQTLPESVHLANWPTSILDLEDAEIIAQNDLVRKVVGLALQLRNQRRLKVRQPLNTLYVVANTEYERIALLNFASVVAEQVNVKTIEMLDGTSDLEEPYLDLNFRVAGPTLKGELHTVSQIVKSLKRDEMELALNRFHANEPISLPGYESALGSDIFEEKVRSRVGIVTVVEYGLTVALDTELTDELIQEGIIRDLVRYIQSLRKETNLDVTQHIRIAIETDSEYVQQALSANLQYLMKETLADRVELGQPVDSAIASKTLDMDEGIVSIHIVS